MKFCKLYEPRIGEYDKNGNLSLKSIIAILEDIAAKHSASVNENVVESAVNGISWILIEWNVIIKKLPRNDEKLQVSTCAISKKSELITQREFEIQNENGETLINACERLALEDFKASKLLRISPQLLKDYKPEENLNYPFDLNKIKEPSEYFSQKEIEIRKSDIDYNNHVHNTCYIDYAREIFPQETTVSGYRILYKKPLFEKDKPILKYDGDRIVGIYNSNGELCTLVKFEIT